jgi:PadR family transcriptional regulator PadR
MAAENPRMSAQTLRILDALSGPRAELAGADISRQTGLGPGTVYPVLYRLERADWLGSRWEVEDPATLGRPRQKFYWLTPLGCRNARTAARNLEPAIRRLAWG